MNKIKTMPIMYQIIGVKTISQLISYIPVSFTKRRARVKHRMKLKKKLYELLVSLFFICYLCPPF